MFKTAVNFKGGVNQAHQIVSIDVCENPYETDNNSSGLAFSDADSIDVVIQNKDEKRSCDYNGVDERIRQHKVHTRVNKLMNAYQHVPNDEILEISRTLEVQINA